MWKPFSVGGHFELWLFRLCGGGAVSDWVCFGLKTIQYCGVSLVALDIFSFMPFLVQVAIYVTLLLLHKPWKLLNIGYWWGELISVSILGVQHI